MCVAATIQLTLNDAKYREALTNVISRDAAFRDWKIESASAPKPGVADVLVLDSAALARLGDRLRHPERIVLIARNQPEELTRAWKAGIVSVVFDHEPLATTLLAILAARYRSCRFVA